jgi:DNA polymerase
MDARETLRRYLEQRRDMGERELVLDDLSVDDVMRMLGASAGAATADRPGSPRPASSPNASPNLRTPDAPPDTADWRSVLRSADAEAPPRAPRAADRPAPAPPPRTVSEPDEPATTPPANAEEELVPTADAPLGIIVGAARGHAAHGPLSHLTSLDDVARAVAACTLCDLCKSARNPVPGDGSPTARLVCVGEAPGESEDATGRPFVGRAGQLLTRILAAIQLTREEVFICNVLKHRPPGNRNPTPEEIAACSPYLIRQLELIRPSVILAFGAFAAQTLLDSRQAIGKLRGFEHRYHGIPLVVTYHPAALLRNPNWKRPAWDDVKLARRILDSAANA